MIKTIKITFYGAGPRILSLLYLARLTSLAPPLNAPSFFALASFRAVTFDRTSLRSALHGHSASFSLAPQVRRTILQQQQQNLQPARARFATRIARLRLASFFCSACFRRFRVGQYSASARSSGHLRSSSASVRSRARILLFRDWCVALCCVAVPGGQRPV